MNARTAALLSAILLLALAVRAVGIAANPPGFWSDESALAVNAALIAEAGVDQYGERWPLFFRALDDYKEPLFVYSVAASVKLLGRTVESARLPAALWGALGVLVAFALGREMAGTAAGLWTAAFVAVTPWHIHFSRWCEQAIVLSVVYSAAVLFMIRLARHGRPGDGLLAGVLLAAGLYAYSPGKLLVVASVVAFSAVAWHRGRWRTTGFATFLAAFALAVLPFAAFYLAHGDAMNLRLQRVRIPWTETPGAYLSHFDLRFLFGRGDADIRLSTRTASLPWYLGPLALVGAVVAVRRRSTAGLAIVAILLFTPVLGALTHRYPHATRTLTASPFVQLLAAGGLGHLLERAPVRFRTWAAVLASVVVAAAFAVFWNHYWNVYRFRSRPEWNHGLVRALEFAARGAREGTAVYAPPARYCDWMFATRTEAAQVMGQEALRGDPNVYDPWDTAGKYDFIRPRAVTGARARKAWNAEAPPSGLWVVAVDDAPPGFAADCELRTGGFCVARLP